MDLSSFLFFLPPSFLFFPFKSTLPELLWQPSLVPSGLAYLLVTAFFELHIIFPSSSPDYTASSYHVCFYLFLIVQLIIFTAHLFLCTFHFTLGYSQSNNSKTDPIV